jgi:hypothetical protein
MPLAPQGQTSRFDRFLQPSRQIIHSAALPRTFQSVGISGLTDQYVVLDTIVVSMVV